MPPQSRGSPMPTGLYSKSTPNLPTLRSLNTDAEDVPPPEIQSARLAAAQPPSPVSQAASSQTSLSEPGSIDDFPLDAAVPDISSGSSESESDNAPISNLPPRPFLHHHSRSHTYLGPSTFAPPFYNRPPTPLPPSPSLTSLLRPNFSAHASRPTTPDPSSDEGTSTRNARFGGSQTPLSGAAATLTTSFRTARPIPRASPKVPTYEYYGFTLYLTSSLVFLIYILWSFLPSPFLHQIGIYYYPNRWWSLAIPAWLVMLVVWIYVALASYNTGYLTLKMGEVECLVDEAAQIAVVDEMGKIIRKDRASKVDGHGRGAPNGSAGKRGKGGRTSHSRRNSDTNGNMQTPELDWRTLWNEGTDAVMDVPIGGVCEVLYGYVDESEA